MAIRILHWVLAFLIPLYIVIAGGAGYEALISIPVAVASFLGLLALAIVVTVRKTPPPPLFVVLSVIMWVVSLGFPLTLDREGDDAVHPAPFESLGLPVGVDAALAWIFPAVSFVLWLATLLSLVLARRTALSRVHP